MSRVEHLYLIRSDSSVCLSGGRLFGSVLLSLAAVVAQAQTITTFDTPDAGTALGQGTQAGADRDG